MKRTLSALSIIVALVLFAGCNSKAENTAAKETTAAESAETTIPESVATPAETTAASKIEEETAAEQTAAGGAEAGKEGLSDLLDLFPVSDIAAPDGTTLSKYDAIDAYDNRIVFDCGYVRYAKPLFDNTDISPWLFNWDTYEFNNETGESDNTGYFQVKEGQQLDNGLTVSKAETTFSVINVEDDNGNKRKETAVVNSIADFSGEITIEGVLYCFPGTPEYIDVQGDLKFYPNPTADESILVPYDMVQMPTRIVDPNRNYALIFDGCSYSLGNINDVSVNIKSLFETTDYVNAKITVSNIRIIYDDEFAGRICYGELKQVEAI